MPDVDVVDADVLVIGGGGAASRAAIEAYLAGAKVVLAVKGGYGAIGTRGAGATSSARHAASLFRAVGLPGVKQQSPQEIYEDILQAGLGMADPKLAEILANEALGSVRALAGWGVPFDGGPHGLRSHGVPLMSGLVSVVRRSGITLKERTFVSNLLVQEGEVVGAIALDEDGKVSVIKAAAVVLATGGDAQLFKFNMNPPCVTGDGYAMAYDLGAELFNMEFKQVFLGTVYPTVNLLQCWVFGQRVKITNRDGKKFIDGYLPPGATLDEAMSEHALHNPFSTRDRCSRHILVAMVEEVKAGRGNEHDAVHMDLAGLRVPPYWQDWFVYRGVHWDTEPAQVNACHQCSDGGLRVDEHGQTSVPGLYGCGEVISGPHGADRLGGSSLAASQVFGARAGRHAARSAYRSRKAEVRQDTIARGLQPLRQFQDQAGTERPRPLRRRLQQVAWEEMLTARSEPGLNRVLGAVREIRELLPRIRVETPLDLIEALELGNLLRVAEITARVSLHRQESRGAHYRVEYPAQDDRNWLRAISAKNVGGQMVLGTLLLDANWKPRPGDMGNQGWG